MKARSAIEVRHSPRDLAGIAMGLNYTYFGNVVAPVHRHIIPRFEDDPDRGQAPWRENEKTPAPGHANALAAAIAVRLETLSTDD